MMRYVFLPTGTAYSILNETSITLSNTYYPESSIITIAGDFVKVRSFKEKDDKPIVIIVLKSKVKMVTLDQL